MQERLEYLFDRYLKNTCTRSEMEEFFLYVRRSEEEPALRQLIKSVYDKLRNDSSYDSFVDHNGQLIIREPAWVAESRITDEGERPVTRKSRLVAVGVLFLLMVGTVLVFSRLAGVKRTGTVTVSALTKKATDRSESKYLLLSDSTQVWLNAASSLEFPDQFNGRKREVYLSGEAYFDVKHADNIPFIIHTGNVSTTVLGTAFNIKAYPGQRNITVSVSRGKVRVSRKNGIVATLINGQQVKVEDGGTEIVEKAIPTNKVAAWKEGNILYDDETFAEIITDMERTYNVSIDIHEEALRGLKISTSFKREIGIEQALQVLCKLTDSKLVKEPGGGYLIQ